MEIRGFFWRRGLPAPSENPSRSGISPKMSGPASLNCRCSLIGYSPYTTLANFCSANQITSSLLFSDLDHHSSPELVRAGRKMELVEDQSVGWRTMSPSPSTH
ncbi:hypothetical protein TNCV_3744881 [Trichonephila clavipes]|nr:hypothetical protein TNCV_3744881 [Trichonephila clavipes]